MMTQAIESQLNEAIGIWQEGAAGDFI